MKAFAQWIMVTMLTASQSFAGNSESSSGASDVGRVGSAMANATGTALISLGVDTENAWLIGLGVVCIGAGTAMSESATGASETSSAFAPGGSKTGGVFSGPGDLTDAQINDIQNKANEALKVAAKAGVTLNKDGSVTTPKGKFPAGAFNDLNNLASLGLTPEQIADLDAKVKKANADAFKMINLTVANGGGGSSSKGGSSKGSDFNFDFGFNKQKPKAPVTTGLTRSLASGESIGTASDNIFEMIRRSYQKKSAEKIFVGQ